MAIPVPCDNYPPNHFLHAPFVSCLVLQNPSQVRAASSGVFCVQFTESFPEARTTFYAPAGWQGALDSGLHYFRLARRRHLHLYSLFCSGNHAHYCPIIARMRPPPELTTMWLHRCISPLQTVVHCVCFLFLRGVSCFEKIVQHAVLRTPSFHFAQLDCSR